MHVPIRRWVEASRAWAAIVTIAVRCLECGRFLAAPELSDVAGRVTGHQATILRDLIDRPTCDLERLFDQCYGQDPEGGPDTGTLTIKTWISFLRKKLKPGWTITHNERMYRLEYRP